MIMTLYLYEKKLLLDFENYILFLYCKASSCRYLLRDYLAVLILSWHDTLLEKMFLLYIIKNWRSSLFLSTFRAFFEALSICLEKKTTLFHSTRIMFSFPVFLKRNVFLYILEIFLTQLFIRYVEIEALSHTFITFLKARLQSCPKVIESNRWWY